MFAFLFFWGKKCICFVLVNILLISVLKTDVRLKSKGIKIEKTLHFFFLSICLFGALIEDSWKLRILFFMKPYGMVWIGTDLNGHLVQIPLLWAELPPTTLIATSPIPAWLWTLPGMEHLQLWATCSSSTLVVTNFFLMSKFFQSYVRNLQLFFIILPGL